MDADTQTHGRRQTDRQTDRHMHTRRHLWGFKDGFDNSLDAERDLVILLIRAVHKACTLPTTFAPRIQEAIEQHVVLKLDVVHVAVFLPLGDAKPAAAAAAAVVVVVVVE